MSNTAIATTLSGRIVPPSDVQRRVRALIAREGVGGAAKALGLARQTTLAIAAGVTLNAGSILQADARAPG